MLTKFVTNLSVLRLVIYKYIKEYYFNLQKWPPHENHLLPIGLYMKVL